MSIEINEDYFEVFIDGPAIAKYFTAAERDEIKRRVRTSCSSSESARIAELEKALRPFADCAKYLPDPNQDFPNDVVALDMGDGRIWTLQDWSFFEARTTLAASERGGGE